jgi:hypothetical protein
MEMGTEILLARMKEYPEEFINDNRVRRLDGLRWDSVLREAREHLPEEDVKALEAGMKQLYIDRFNERVLKVLAGESEPEQPEGTITYKATNRYAAGGGMADPRGLFGAQVETQVDAHREYMNEMARQQGLMHEIERETQRARNSAKNMANIGRSFFKFGRAD